MKDKIEILRAYLQALDCLIYGLHQLGIEIHDDDDLNFVVDSMDFNKEHNRLIVKFRDINDKSESNIFIVKTEH